MSKNTLNLPYLGFGLGLRAVHTEEIIRDKPAIDWFEIITENYLDSPAAQSVLRQVRSHYPIVMHGVSLSIGSTDPLNIEYLEKLKKMAEWLEPAWVSDHLCWTGVLGKNTHDLLPVPYTEESLNHIVSRIEQVQDFLKRPLILENPSTYLQFADSIIPEWEFLALMAKRSGCGLLLDINNIYVSCFNHGWDAQKYLAALPLDSIVQVHLAGHRHKKTHIIDTHDAAVSAEVWALYRDFIAKKGAVSTMIEWDDAIPSLDVLTAELHKARECNVASSYKKAYA